MSEKHNGLPKRIERIDDGEIFELNDNGKYSMVNSGMVSPHEYSYERLMDDHRAKGKFRVMAET